jgi:hypothetical protein
MTFFPFDLEVGFDCATDFCDFDFDRSLALAFAVRGLGISENP